MFAKSVSRPSFSFECCAVANQEKNTDSIFEQGIRLKNVAVCTRFELESSPDFFSL